MEVLVAIAIIMTVITIGTIVFLNVTGSSFTGEKLNASLLMNEISISTRKEKTFFDDEITGDGITVSKKIDKYNGQSNLIFLHLAAFNQSGKLLGERKEILLVENE